MKDKRKERAKVAGICAGGILGCLALYYFVDDVWNGLFLDWFSRKYMREYYTTYFGERMRVVEPAWGDIKSMIFLVLCVGVLIYILSVWFISHHYARVKVTEAVTAVSEEIRTYMSREDSTLEIFPKEYAEISAQMAEIRSAMQRHEQLLKEEAARKNDLITYLAHDLKTPLTSVIGYLSLLDEIPEMPEKQRTRYIGISLDKSRRLENLINEFFDITRYNLQRMELEMERVDLYYLLLQLTDEFYPILKEHGNTIELESEENLTVYADAEKLARVFNNLLKNAIAYSYPNTPVRIRTEITGTGTWIYVSDHGPTIPSQKLDSIFDKFFRLDEARGTNQGGAGLGLAIAREIISLHHGTITAESQDETTTFRVFLPDKKTEGSGRLYPGSQEEAAEKPSPGAEPDGKK